MVETPGLGLSDGNLAVRLDGQASGKIWTLLNFLFIQTNCSAQFPG